LINRFEKKKIRLLEYKNYVDSTKDAQSKNEKKNLQIFYKQKLWLHYSFYPCAYHLFNSFPILFKTSIIFVN